MENILECFINSFIQICISYEKLDNIKQIQNYKH